MTAQTPQKNRSRGGRDFIPNFELRSVLVIASFAVSVAAARAQTAPGAPPASLGQNNPVAMTAAADRGERPSGTVAQNTGTRRDLDAAFNRADVNRDGRLNREEAEHFPMLAQRFELIDDNRDTFISREEFNTAAGN